MHFVFRSYLAVSRFVLFVALSIGEFRFLKANLYFGTGNLKPKNTTNGQTRLPSDFKRGMYVMKKWCPVVWFTYLTLPHNKSTWSLKRITSNFVSVVTKGKNYKEAMTTIYDFKVIFQ